MTLKSRSTFAVFAAAIAFSGAVQAQKNYQRSIDYGVTIYEHCNFEGKSQTLKPGEYSSLRGIGFGNDSVSSIRVPRGSEAVIYRDDDFRGSYARIDTDIRCFDKQWNDEASSISVRETAYNSRDDKYRRNDNNGYDGRDYDNRNRGNSYNRQNQVNVTAKNVSQVVFDGFSLQQVAKQQWSMDSNRGSSKQFQEVRRDQDIVYLENQYTAERVRIDLFANDVTIVNRNGRQQRYSINSKNATLASRGSTGSSERAPTVNHSVNRRINAECFNFKAYTTGGNASVRFIGKSDLYRFNKKASTGRICHNGTLVMEIGKTAPGTNVTVAINGNVYRFSAGEKEHSYLNSWYRKSVKLKVGR